MPVNRNIILPQWLDDYIFNHLGAKYNRVNGDMVVLEWGVKEILYYLGTYFPRSYTEAYCIFKHYFQEQKIFTTEESINLLDFGCGTGGEIIGLAVALAECRPNIKTLKVKAIDGNQFALNRFDDIKDEFNEHHHIQIMCNPSAIQIDDFYDLSVLDEILVGRYDIIISFKAVCEFVTKQQFEEKNAYEHLAKFMMPKLSDAGIMLLVDVTSKNNVVQEWLPDLMDRGLRNANATVLKRNPLNSQTFVIDHSRRKGDISKIAWRLITK